MLNKKRISKHWIILGSILLILIIPGVFIISNRNHILNDSKSEVRINMQAISVGTASTFAPLEIVQPTWLALPHRPGTGKPGIG